MTISSDYNPSSSLTASEKIIVEEMILIEEREDAGKKAYKRKTAELTLQRQSNNIDHSVFADNIYIPLKSVIDSVNSGHWLDAYYQIESVGINPYLTLELKQAFKVDIANYIVYSGTYPEYTGATIDATGNIVI